MIGLSIIYHVNYHIVCCVLNICAILFVNNHFVFSNLYSCNKKESKVFTLLNVNLHILLIKKLIRRQFSQFLFHQVGTKAFSSIHVDRLGMLGVEVEDEKHADDTLKHAIDFKLLHAEQGGLVAITAFA